MRPFVYTLYFAPIAIGAILLIRSVYLGSVAAEHAVPQTFVCATATKQLEAELWILYDTNLRALDSENVKREPLPNRWRNWEATRVQAAHDCVDARFKMEALLKLRRTLESNLFLLAHEAGDALAELHK